MISIYKAAHLADAQMVVDILAQDGITACIFGAGLGSAAGELPMDSSPDVRVLADDVDRARAAIAAWEQTPVDEPVANDPPHLPRSLMPALIALLAGVMIGSAGTHLMKESPRHATESDFDEDGVVDERSIYHGERYVRTEYDRNGDGKVDEVFEQGRRFGDSTQKSDQDFDGRYEMRTEYRLGQPVTTSIDYDGDGHDDYSASYHQGVVTGEEYRDERTHRVTLRYNYAPDYTSISEIDTDGDGVFDEQRRHDRRGEVSGVEPIAR